MRGIIATAGRISSTAFTYRSILEFGRVAGAGATSPPWLYDAAWLGAGLDCGFVVTAAINMVRLVGAMVLRAYGCREAPPEAHSAAISPIARIIR